MKKAFAFTADAMIALSIAALFMGAVYYFNLNAVHSMSSIDITTKIHSMDEVVKAFYSAENPSEGLRRESIGFCSKYLKYSIIDNSLSEISSCVTVNE